ncbi:hypothetical protein C8F04DRAFT_452419 [Mycena alexandri]|uniref:Secreted peptide n=1 Tax=Mycena alexandri TaxID=1745969 RepID=A0AAD6XFA5_9AGAR|nr:hypothetical protein C8F04DRAFT_452419 [Mycena alexandri]
MYSTTRLFVFLFFLCFNSDSDSDSNCYLSRSYPQPTVSPSLYPYLTSVTLLIAPLVVAVQVHLLFSVHSCVPAV